MINLSKDREQWRLITPLIKDHEDKNKHRIYVKHQEMKEIRRFVLDKTANLPRYVKRRLLRHYVQIFNKKHPETNELFANIWLREVVKPVEDILKKCPFKNLKALRRDEIIKNYAQKAAGECVSAVSACAFSDDYQTNLLFAFDELAAYCREWGVCIPYLNVISKRRKEKEGEDTQILISALESAILRVCCDKWWLNKLKRIKDQTNEHVFIVIGEVQKKISPYISAQSLSEWKSQQRANRDYLESMELVKTDFDADTGAEFESVVNLVDMADGSTSNPKHRFSELMLRCRGIENISAEDGYIGLFLTLTAPSKFHATRKNGSRNPKYNGSTPKQSQAYLVSVWAKIRARLQRVENVSYYGVRVTEPHHDATPHWHLLIFVNPSAKDVFIKTCRDYALLEDGEEKGAEKHRFTVETIDPSKGSATGYIAKYLSKNINGEYLNNSEDNKDYDSGKSADDGAQRATAWASRWNLRQFQFFGCEPVTIYREARRLTMSVEDVEVEKIRQAVETEKGNKWQAFTKAMQESRVNLAYEVTQNNYAEKIKKIKGLISSKGYEETRQGGFVLRKRGSVSRSPVNNCTEPDSMAIQLQGTGLNYEEIALLRSGCRVAVGHGIDYQIKNGHLREFSA